MTSLYVDRRGIELEVDGEALVFRENGERIGTIPLAPISRVFLRGDVRLQSSLLGKLGERGIGVVVLSGRQGKVSLLMARPHNDASRRIRQYRLSLDEQFCLTMASEIVRNKLISGRNYLHSFLEENLEHRYEISLATRKMDAITNTIHDKNSIAEVRGAEGAGAAAYFQGIAAIAPPRLKFSQRNRRPPRDPLNALLSLGYTLLHSEAVLALYAVGLDPYIGFLHHLEFGRESLACDIMEPLRAEVDRFSLQAFRSDLLRIEDFTTTESGCMLGKNGRAKFYAQWDSFSEKLRKLLVNSIDELVAKMAANNAEESPSCVVGS